MTRMVSRRKLLLGFSALAGTLTSKMTGAQSLPVRSIEEDYKEDLFYREDWLGEPWRMPEPVVLIHGNAENRGGVFFAQFFHILAFAVE